MDPNATKETTAHSLAWCLAHASCVTELQQQRQRRRQARVLSVPGRSLTLSPLLLSRALVSRPAWRLLTLRSS